MVVAYHWKLHSDIHFVEGSDPLEVIERLELPIAANGVRDLGAIREHWPIDLCESAANGEWEKASAAESLKDFRTASRHFQRAATYVERFDGPEAITFIADCYGRAAQCELSLGLAVLAVGLLRQVVALKSRMTTSVDDDRELLSRAVIQDDAHVGKIEDMIDTRERSAHAAGEVNYLLYRPTPKRIGIARRLISTMSQTDPESVLLAARCAAAEGDVGAAVAAIDSMKPIPPVASGWREEWLDVSERRGLHVARPVFRGPDEDPLPSVADEVNRGFNLLANALYLEALRWFMAALAHSGRRDSFALFGHGLTTWRMGAFGIGKRSLAAAFEALKVYPREYRLLLFSRDDPTSEPRSYRDNPVYPIFDMNECLVRAARCENFNRHDILP